MFEIDSLVRNFIGKVFEQHPGVLNIAIRQRSKFEGWLKLELANYFLANGATDIKIEYPFSGSNQKVDLFVEYGGRDYYIELKTLNTPLAIPGVERKLVWTIRHIPSIIEDMNKLYMNLSFTSAYGIIAFVLFPLPCGDVRWHKFLKDISTEKNVPLSEENNCVRHRLNLRNQNECDLVICAFSYPSKK